MDHPRVHHPAAQPSLSELASLDREELISRLLNFDGKCRLDFSEGFLAAKSTDRLRHILLAAYQHVARCD